MAPFPGATTGTGGRIRDVQAAGRGGHVVAGTAGYCFGNLHIPGTVFHTGIAYFKSTCKTRLFSVTGTQTIFLADPSKSSSQIDKVIFVSYGACKFECLLIGCLTVLYGNFNGC